MTRSHCIGDILRFMFWTKKEYYLFISVSVSGFSFFLGSDLDVRNISDCQISDVGFNNQPIIRLVYYVDQKGLLSSVLLAKKTGIY